MKTTTILFSIALAFETIYSKAIDNISKQSNVSKVEDPFEIVKSKNFIYKFHCSEEKNVCDGFKNDIDYAFNAISKTFEIYKPVSLEVFVDDLTLKHGLGGTLAAVTDTNCVALKTTNKKSSAPYLYPQALVKQLKLNKKPKYKENDFTLLINNCNSLPQYKDNEIRSIIIHEMLHGLGFISAPSVKKLNAETDTDELYFDENDQYGFVTGLVPSFSKKLMNINDITEYMNQLENSKVSKFMPLYVFDKYIVSLKTGEYIFKDMPFYYKEINRKCFPKGSLSIKDLTDEYIFNCIKNISPETQNITSRIIRDNYFNYGTLGIKTYDGKTITLQTLNGSYNQGNSVSHTNNPLKVEYYSRLNKYGYGSDQANELFDLSTGSYKKEYILKYYDENYILYYSDEDDFTVEEMIQLLPNNKKHPLIGNGIVKIMKTIGWTGKGEKRNRKVHYLDETINIPESGTFKYMSMKPVELSNNNKNTLNETEIETTGAQTEEKSTLSKRTFQQLIHL